MSSSGWSCYRCLVWKIIISLKNSFKTVCSWKKRAFVACRQRSETGPAFSRLERLLPTGPRATPTNLISIEVAWEVPARPWSERFGSIVWTSTQNWVRLCSCRFCSSICCSATPYSLQWTWRSGNSKWLRTQLNVFDVIMRRNTSIHIGEMQ